MLLSHLYVMQENVYLMIENFEWIKLTNMTQLLIFVNVLVNVHY